MVRRDPLQTGDVDVAGLELRVEDVEVRDVFDDDALKIRTLTEIVWIGDKLDVIAGDPVAPFERTGADRRIVERRGVLVSRLAQRMLGNDEGRREDRRIGRIGLFHPPSDLGR